MAETTQTPERTAAADLGALRGEVHDNLIFFGAQVDDYLEDGDGYKALLDRYADAVHALYADALAALRHQHAEAIRRAARWKRAARINRAESRQWESFAGGAERWIQGLQGARDEAIRRAEDAEAALREVRDLAIYAEWAGVDALRGQLRRTHVRAAHHAGED